MTLMGHDRVAHQCFRRSDGCYEQMEIANKRALVLGGTSGIGFATAKQLAVAGAEVIAGGSSEASIEAARASTGDSIAYHVTDVLDRDALAGLFADSAPFDILVNTAAPRARAQGPFRELDLDAFQGAFGKLWGYVNSVQLGLEHMTEAGSIVIISGSPARKAPPGTSAISTVGNAVEGFVRAIAPEIAPVRINAVSPGTHRYSVDQAARGRAATVFPEDRRRPGHTASGTAERGR